MFFLLVIDRLNNNNNKVQFSQIENKKKNTHEESLDLVAYLVLNHG